MTITITELPALLTPAEVAECLRVHPRTLRRLALPVVHIGGSVRSARRMFVASSASPSEPLRTFTSSRKPFQGRSRSHRPSPGKLASRARDRQRAMQLRERIAQRDKRRAERAAVADGSRGD